MGVKSSTGALDLYQRLHPYRKSASSPLRTYQLLVAPQEGVRFGLV